MPAITALGRQRQRIVMSSRPDRTTQQDPVLKQHKIPSMVIAQCQTVADTITSGRPNTAMLKSNSLEQDFTWLSFPHYTFLYYLKSGEQKWKKK